MSNSVAQLHKTAKQPICFHRDKTNQLFATFLGLGMMAFPASKLLAANPFLTPIAEEFFVDKTTKASGFLDDLINHNAYMGNIPPFALNPNATHLIFAMNHENELGKKVDEHSEESAGAAAQQPRPLIEIPLPLLDHDCIYDILQVVDTGLDADTLRTILSHVPEILPKESLTIANMIQQLIKTLHLTVNEDENDLMAILYSVQGIESPIDTYFPDQKINLVIFMASYYAAIHSNGATPEAAHFFFNSFLLKAIFLSCIGILHNNKGELLGNKEPIKDHEVLKANVKESVSVISTIKYLKEINIRHIQQLDNTLKAEKSETLIDPIIKAASALLNCAFDVNSIPYHQRNIKSDERMLVLIKEYGEKNPELVASINQFENLINSIYMFLDPFLIESAGGHLRNFSSYFRKSNWDDTVTNSTNKKGKEQKLFAIFEEVINDAIHNVGNEDPHIFQELLIALSNYIEQQLQKTFPDANEYQVIMVTLGTGFVGLLEQSQTTLARYEQTIGSDINQPSNRAQHDEAAKGQEGKELSKVQRKRKLMKERIKYLSDFVDWFRSHYDFAIKAPYDSDSDDPNSSRDSNDAAME
ncbi:hypothetical protein [Endozoicomonas sp. ISHI1]|uniref:hypothetical protein n=2 Tax=Endozoicomonas TaxID=305899 RepID=UPI002149541A|nr:hypothetical protein [Endozoicomonas sp. ISHI1]